MFLLTLIIKKISNLNYKISIILPASERIVNYSAGMENMTENVSDDDEYLDQDIFVDSSDNNYSRELEDIKNQGIEGRLEVRSALNAQFLLKSLCSHRGWDYQVNVFSAALPRSQKCKVDLI